MAETARRRSSTPSAPLGISLRELLRAQPDAAFERLLAKRRVEIDPNKQLDAHEQAARALAPLPRRLIDSLGSAAREALELLVARPGWLPRGELGGGALALVEAGLVFSHPAEPDALVLPGAYRLQLASPRSESRHAARALLASLDEDTRDDVIATFHGRRSSVAWALTLEPVLLTLESPARIESLLLGVDRDALLALSAIEARGGELAVDAYLDLCREPARWNGSRIPRRGAAFLLVANALVMPVSEARIVMPAEVAEVVGRERRSALASRRAAAIQRTETREDEPQRASLASPPGAQAVAVWIETAGAGRAPGRAAISRASRRSGRSFEQTLLLASLADATPMRTATLASYGPAVLETWRGGRAWDELLETPRVSEDEPLETPTVVLHACTLDALATLPRGRFAERASVRAAIASDLRFDGVRTAFERARARRIEGWVATLDEGIERILDVSLPALGLVDVGQEGSLRLASWAARALASAGELHDGDAAPDEQPGVVEKHGVLGWESSDRLRLGPSQRLSVLAPLAGCADAVADGESLVLVLDPDRVPLEGRDRILATLTRLGCPDVEGFAARCPRPRGAGRAQRASLVVTLEDLELARELREAPSLARWLLSPHPDGPLLAFVEAAPRGIVVRALERLGVRVEELRAEAARAKPKGRGRARIR